MGVIGSYASGVYPLGRKGKSKRHKDGYSTMGHIEEHLEV